MKYIIILIAIMLSGCHADTDSEQSIEKWLTKQYRVPGGYVNDIRLQDGTRCVYCNGHNKHGGVVCDWRSSSVEVNP